MSKDIKDIIHDLRNQLTRRGHGLTMRSLGLAFKVNAKDGGGQFFSYDDLDGLLRRAGLQLKKPDMLALFRYFDDNGDNKISYIEFLEGLQVLLCLSLCCLCMCLCVLCVLTLRAFRAS